MSISFPNSPSLNDTYSYNGKTWRWDGVAWSLINVPTIVGIFTVTNSDGVFLKSNDLSVGTASSTINFSNNFTVSSSSGIGSIGFNTTSTVTAAAFIGDGSGLINLPAGSQWVTNSSGVHTTSNVGIGTTNPLVSLQVSGNVSVSGIVSTGGVISTSSVTLTQSPFFRNTPTISTDYTVTTQFNEMSIGPITINNGVTVTVNSGATWTIV